MIKLSFVPIHLRRPLLWSTGPLFLFATAHAQPTFQRAIGGIGADYTTYAIPATDGPGYVLTGTATTAQGPDLYLVKVNGNGDVQWTKTYGGANEDDGRCLMRTPDGGYVLLGQTQSFGATDQDLYLLRTDAAGALQWARRYAAAGADYPTGIQQAADEGYLLGGSTSQGAGVIDAMVVRTDAEGNTLWTRTYGGALEDDGNAVAMNSDGTFVLAGITHSFGAGGVDAMLVKADANGDVLWTRTYGGTNDDYAFAIDTLPGGGYVVAGSTRSAGAGDYDMLLMKIDADGTLLWSKSYGSTDTDLGGSVRRSADGGYVVLGQSFGFGVASDLYLVRTDADGDTLWTRTYGGSGYEFESSVLPTPDGGYVLGAGEESFGADRDAYLVKTDAQGHSGCNEGGTATVVGSPAFTTSSPTLSVGTSTLTATTASTVTGSDGTSTVLCGTAGITTLPAPIGITASPVPFTSSFRVSHTERNGSLVLLDATGRVCGTYRTTDVSTTIDAGTLKPGAYLLQYRCAGGSAVLRLVKE